MSLLLQNNVNVNIGRPDRSYDPDDAYDQVVALSQNLLNEKFREFWDKRGLGDEFKDLHGPPHEVPNLQYENSEHGSLDALLDAPTILIKAKKDGSTQLFYQLRIKLGSITFRDSRSLQIHNWIISIPVYLREILPPWKRKDDDGRYPLFPCYDYSVQQLFRAIGGGGWQDPNEQLSSCWDKGKQRRVGFLDWEPYRIYRQSILALFAAWAGEQEAKKLSTFGLCYDLKDPKFGCQPSTFRVQGYPFLTDEESKAASTWNGGSAPYLPDSDLNCLVFCQNLYRIGRPAAPGPSLTAVPSALPPKQTLDHGGNLAHPDQASPVPLLGSFLWSRQKVFRKAVLVVFEPLCRGIRLQVQPPGRALVPTSNFWAVNPDFLFGHQGDTLIAMPGEWAAMERLYKWSPTESAEQFGMCPESQNLNGLSRHTQPSSTKIEGTWSFGLDFVVRGSGFLGLEIFGLDRYGRPQDLRVKPTDYYARLLDDEQFSRQFEQATQRGIQGLLDNLKDDDQNFKIPGARELRCQRPLFNRRGDLVVPVDYHRGFDRELDNLKFPKTQRRDPPPTPSPQPGPVEPTRPTTPPRVPPNPSHPNTCQLVWNAQFSYNKESKMAKVLLRATNEFKDMLSFGYIEATLVRAASGANAGKALFRGRQWTAAELPDGSTGKPESGQGNCYRLERGWELTDEDITAGIEENDKTKTLRATVSPTYGDGVAADALFCPEQQGLRA